MKIQLSPIFGVGPSVPDMPAVATAPPFRIEAQTKEGPADLTLTFEAARELKKELEIYLHRYRDR